MKFSCEGKKCDMEHYIYFFEKLCRILGFDTYKRNGLDNPDFLFPSFLFVLEGDNDYIIAD